MINKICSTALDAVHDVPDGATIAVGGFGGAGMPDELIDALIEQGAKELVVVSNNAGNGDSGLAALLKARRVRRLLCSFPRQKDAYVFEALYRAARIELEVVPQGNLAERLRAAGCGIGAFYTPTGFGTMLAENKETRRINDRDFVLEYPIHVDFALINGKAADRSIHPQWESSPGERPTRHEPLNAGLRFSTKAAMPSFWSSKANSE